MDKKTKGILFMAITATVLSLLSVVFSILAAMNIGIQNVNPSFYVNFVVLFVACAILWVCFFIERKRGNEPEKPDYENCFEEEIVEDIEINQSENAENIPEITEDKAECEENTQDIEE